ncbi:MAG: hypothetical protein ABI824_08950 [Acidobacteriota bacterium]
MRVQMLEKPITAGVLTHVPVAKEVCLEEMLDSVCRLAENTEDLEMRILAHWLRRTTQSIRQLGTSLDQVLRAGNTDEARRAEILGVMSDLFQLGQFENVGYPQGEEIPR